MAGETTYFSGSFGLSSTARDYLHFEQMLANGGELFGRRLLGPRSVAMMTSNHVGDLFDGSSNKGGKGMGFGLYRLGCSRSDCGRQPAQCGGLRLGRGFRYAVLDRPGRETHRRHHAAATLRACAVRLRKRRSASDHRLKSTAAPCAVTEPFLLRKLPRSRRCQPGVRVLHATTPAPHRRSRRCALRPAVLVARYATATR